MISVASDYEGLKLAAMEMFIETMSRPNERVIKLAEDAVNRDQMLREYKNNRTLSPGYYSRVAYLIELEETLDIVRFDLRDIKPSELQGLKVIREVRAEFNSRFPTCPQCGERNNRLAPRCKGCSVEFRRQHGSGRTTGR